MTDPVFYMIYGQRFNGAGSHCIFCDEIRKVWSDGFMVSRCMHCGNIQTLGHQNNRLQTARSLSQMIRDVGRRLGFESKTRGQT